MLIYLSSYPRSGNTWVRNLLRHYFGYRSASVYPEPQGAPNLELRSDGSFELFSFYELSAIPGSRLPMLMNNCGQLLSEDLRRQLGASDERFFLKTHELPFGRYFPGEYVVHLVREPGAVCWSYYNYLRKNEPAGFGALTLGQVIAGKVPFGDWGTHARAWLAAGEGLGDRFLLHKYEDIASQPETNFADRLAAFTGLRYYTPKQPLAPIEKWHEKEPNFYRKDKESRWKSQYTPAQLHQVLKRYGGAMQQLGYSTDDYQTSLRERLWGMVPFGARAPKTQPPQA